MNLNFNPNNFDFRFLDYGDVVIPMLIMGALILIIGGAAAIIVSIRQRRFRKNSRDDKKFTVKDKLYTAGLAVFGVVMAAFCLGYGINGLNAVPQTRADLHTFKTEVAATYGLTLSDTAAKNLIGDWGFPFDTGSGLTVPEYGQTTVLQHGSFTNITMYRLNGKYVLTSNINDHIVPLPIKA